MKYYLLTMLRDGDKESHHYTMGLYTDLAEATIRGLNNERYRADRYQMNIQLVEVDSNNLAKEVPRDVCVNYAKLKYPEKFDDRGLLKYMVDL